MDVDAGIMLFEGEERRKMTQGMQAALTSVELSLSLPERKQLCQCLDFSKQSFQISDLKTTGQHICIPLYTKFVKVEEEASRATHFLLTYPYFNSFLLFQFYSYSEESDICLVIFYINVQFSGLYLTHSRC